MIHIFLLTLLSYSLLCNGIGERSYGVAEMQGRRSTMEDAHCIEVNEKYGFFGLYDGHGGRDVADYAATTLHINCDLAECATHDDVKNALEKGFLKTHEDLDTADFDARWQGCTAVVALVRDGQLYVAHAGDSRAVLCCAGKAVALTDDHKPGRPDEKQRIEDLGGEVVFWGAWRVNGNLAVSRALGDKHSAPHVIPNPEITQRTLMPQDAFMILACDGVWDVFDNQEAVDIVKESMQNKPRNLDHAAATLRDAAYEKGSTDNISVIVVGLERFKR